MFTFHWTELLVIVLGGLGLLVAITILMLRRRNEILQDFLTPEEPELEEAFFHSLTPPDEEPQPESELPADESASNPEHYE
ncbi:hypothetical protein FACS1894170_10910 [Planctomycetales bacterium]|nr:hypothetical protein FACS1894170_10910 [Planctomycetales bacterium]